MTKYFTRYTLLAYTLGVFLSFCAVHDANAWPWGGGGASHLVKASKYVGTNPSGWSRRWCGKFVHDVLVKSGKRGGGYSAFGYLRYGRPTGCRKGAIAILAKSHVGFVQSCNGNSVTLISGNNRGRPGARVVGVSTYKMSGVKAFRMP